MLFYMMVGFWFGYVFLVIGFGIVVLILIGFFYIGEVFLFWMVFVNGGGLIFGGFWMWWV